MANESGGLPAAPPGTPGFPNNPVPITWNGFTTLNTHATRPAIDDQEMFICDGWMPLGKSNLRILPDKGATIFTASGILTVAFFAFGNIGPTQYCIVFLSDGSIVATPVLAPFIPVTIAPAGTITSPSITTLGVSQWGSQYIIIVSSQTNGYFLWDGTNFYGAGSLGPLVDIIDGGLDYTSAPTVTAVGGAGSGATFQAIVADGSVISISVLNPGTGYGPTDSVYLAFSGGGSAGVTAEGVAIISGGSVTSISITVPGAGYTTLASVTLSGGTGNGALATVSSVTSGSITGVSVTAGGDGYTTSPTVIFSDFSNPVAQATVSPMPFGVSGTAVETFTSRVWVANGAVIQFTAAGSVSDFGPIFGGGATTSVDSFLKERFVGLKQANGFLYLIADSSINYISGVQTTGSPPITTFTNQNVDPQIGTPYPGSIQVFSRNIALSNSFGIHVSYGGAVTKVSPQMDLFFSTPSIFAGFEPSSAVAVIFGIHVYMLLWPVIDQFTGNMVNKLLMWDGQKWWTSQQSLPLLQISTQEFNSVMTAYGTDGTHIFPLFQNPSNSFTKVFRSKLFYNPALNFTKNITRLFSLFNLNTSSTTSQVEIVIDNGLSPVGLTIPGVGIFGGININGFPCSVPGNLLGFTVVTTAEDITFLEISAVSQSYDPNL